MLDGEDNGCARNAKKPPQVPRWRSFSGVRNRGSALVSDILTHTHNGRTYTEKKPAAASPVNILPAKLPVAPELVEKAAKLGFCPIRRPARVWRWRIAPWRPQRAGVCGFVHMVNTSHGQ